MSEQVPGQPLLLTPENIPEEGYLLGPNETLDLSVDVEGRRSEGRLITPTGELGDPYCTVGTLRVGGHNIHDDLDIVVKVGRDGDTQAGILVDELEGEDKLWLPAGSGLMVGRESGQPELGRLSSTVSRKHVMLAQDPLSDTLRIVNLEPSNQTILFPKQRDTHPAPVSPTAPQTPSPRRPQPKIKEAMMAIDPVTGKGVYAGFQDEGDTEARLRQRAAEQAEHERLTGQVAGGGAALQAAANAAAQRRRRARPQARQLPRYWD